MLIVYGGFDIYVEIAMLNMVDIHDVIFMKLLH